MFLWRTSKVKGDRIMRIISVNGNDGVGKSQQIRLLNGSENLHFTGRLIDYTDKWPRMDPVNEFNWWFRDIPSLELVSIIIEAMRARDDTCLPGRLNIHDRGIRMFKAVCAATICVRESLSVEKVKNLIDELFDKAFPGREEEEILLKASSEYQARIKPLVQIVDIRDAKYLPWQSELYARYQTWLAYFMDHYFLDTNPARVIHVNGCILDVQNRIRKVLNSEYKTDMPLVCDWLEKVVAFGGLSESGKSSYAERLSTHHQYYRLKIKYFDEMVKARGLSSSPEAISNELLTFLKNHRHITRVSIESLHGPDLPAYLKLLFGPKMKIVYLDTPLDVRVERTAQALNLSREEAEREVNVKDATKIARGANEVRGIADIVFSNGEDGFEKQFQNFLRFL